MHAYIRDTYIHTYIIHTYIHTYTYIQHHICNTYYVMRCIQVVCVCVCMRVCVQLILLSVSVFGVSQYCQLLAASALSVCPRLCLLQLYYRDRPADLCTPKMASINSPFPHCCVKSRSVNNDAYIIMHCCYINQHCIVPSPSSVLMVLASLVYI